MRLFASSFVFAACVLVVAAGEARADSITGIGFTRVTNNNVENVAGQLSVEVLDAGEANTLYGLGLTDGTGGTATQVLFLFRNNVGTASSISEIYFDDGALLLPPASVHNSLAGETLFSGGVARPPDLPGGMTISPEFDATATISADAQGNPSRGVDTATDVLGISFSVIDGLSGVRSALADGSLRIGLHLRAIGVEGDSDSFVNSNPVPEPGTFFLAALGLVGLGSARRRRRRA